MGIIDDIFNWKFGKKESLPTPNITLTASALPTPIVITGGESWAPVDIKPSSGVIIMKPPKLIVPFTNDWMYLDPRMSKDMPVFMARVKNAGLDIGISCTARLFKCQVALYAQGRQPLDEINRLRLLAGMGRIDAIEAKKIVTWTLVSKHLVNFDNNDPNDDYSQAFDFFLKYNKQAYWDVKASVNKNQIPDYEEVGCIAESFGWEWGGRWKKSPDYPHIQLRA